MNLIAGVRMRRMICFALLGLLVSNGAAFQARAGPGPLVRQRGRVIVLRRFAARARLFPRYGILAPFPYPVWSYIAPLPTYAFIPPSPTYGFVGSDSASHPQLVFKDGTTYTVTDYWRVDDQLHFITIEEGGTKSVPHTVPFGDLDVKRTTDADAAQGFRFLVRDEPIEQWLQHHAQHTPGRHGNNGVEDTHRM
jgi:hypothetical protein